MKIRTLAALLAASAVAAVACHNVPSTTTITGEVPDGADMVYAQYGDVDTSYVAEEDGTFSIEIPSNVLSFAVLQCGDCGVQLIPDGTSLVCDFENETVTSKSPRRSVQERFNGLQNWFADFEQEYSDTLQALYLDAELDEEVKSQKMEAFQDKKIAELKDYLTKVVKKNNNNFVGITAVQYLMMVSENDDEIKAALDLLGDDAMNEESIQSVVKSLETRKTTAEGCMFTDFSVDVCTGFDKDGSRIVKPACLSDYVGNGKYMLVDFWASWCGPCKGEIPYIRDVYEAFAGDNFDVLSIAVWDVPEETYKAAEEEGVEWNQMPVVEEYRSVPTDVYGIDGIPQIILFGPDGTILARDLRGEAIAEKVSEVLGL